MISPPFGFPGTPVLLLLLVVTALIEEKGFVRILLVQCQLQLTQYQRLHYWCVTRSLNSVAFAITENRANKNSSLVITDFELQHIPWN